MPRSEIKPATPETGNATDKDAMEAIVIEHDAAQDAVPAADSDISGNVTTAQPKKVGGRPTVKPTRQPAKFRSKTQDDPNSQLAFGWQDQYNLLGHVADLFDQLGLYAPERRVSSIDGLAKPITLSGRVSHGKVKFKYDVSITPAARFSEHTEIGTNNRTKTKLEPIDHNIENYKSIVILRPGHREDSVEKAIRRLATRTDTGKNGAPVYNSSFTLYGLRQELLRTGHDVKFPDLRESLHILSNTGITLTVENDEGVKVTYRTSYLQGLTMGSRRVDAKHYNPDSDRCHCSLNDIVAKSLSSESYQAFQYEIYMSLSLFLARRFMSILSIEWRNAHPDTRYERSMNELLTRAGQTLSVRVNDDYRATIKALDELKTQGILRLYETEKVITANGRAGKDYKLFLYPTSAFVTTQIEAIQDRTKRTERHSLRRPSLQKVAKD